MHTELLWLRPGYLHHVAHLTTAAQLRASAALLDDVARSRLARMLDLTAQLRRVSKIAHSGG